MPGTSLKAQAIRMLARREYSRAELEQCLIGKGGSRDEVSVVVDELVAAGYVSDARYAQAVATRGSGRYSKGHIARQLKAKGVAAPAASAAIAEAEIDDDAVLAELWRRRYGTLPKGDREKARQVRFLQSRGFSLSAILKLLRSAADTSDE